MNWRMQEDVRTLRVIPNERRQRALRGKPAPRRENRRELCRPPSRGARRSFASLQFGGAIVRRSWKSRGAGGGPHTCRFGEWLGSPRLCSVPGMRLPRPNNPSPPQKYTRVNARRISRPLEFACRPPDHRAGLLRAAVGYGEADWSRSPPPNAQGGRRSTTQASEVAEAGLDPVFAASLSVCQRRGRRPRSAPVG